MKRGGHLVYTCAQSLAGNQMNKSRLQNAVQRNDSDRSGGHAGGWGFDQPLRAVAAEL